MPVSYQKAEQYRETLLIIMQIYFENPRKTVGLVLALQKAKYIERNPSIIF